MSVSNTNPTGSPSVLYTYIAKWPAPPLEYRAGIPARQFPVRLARVPVCALNEHLGEGVSQPIVRRVVFPGRRADDRAPSGDQVVAGAYGMEDGMKFIVAAAAAGLIAFAAPAAAQNSSEPPVITPPPPAKSEPPPATTPPPPSETTPPDPVMTSPPPETVVVVPRTAPPPLEPVTIDPDAAYPNGFADPADPFGNGMSLAYREERGFDWGLLGLLGLLGLIPLFRERAGRRVVYVERDDEARRAVRRDLIDE
jgi:hypothetical protein